MNASSAVSSRPDAVLPDAFFKEFDEVCARAMARVADLAAYVRANYGPASSRGAVIERIAGDLARVRTLAPSKRMRPDRARFVVVDDNEDMRYILARTVRRLFPGATVDVAKGPSEALAILAPSQDGDGIMIICDQDLGATATGTELLGEIAQRHPRARRVLFSDRWDEASAPAGPAPHAVLMKDGSLSELKEYLGALIT